jgi:diacylglycerol kinase (ATP)
MEKRTFLNSFKFALEGLFFSIKNQRNMRIHILIGALVIFLCAILKVSALEIAILILTIMFVIICEMINTALELSLDFFNGKKYHPSVKMIKDIAAGGVLIASINAVIVGAIIFLRNI